MEPDNLNANPTPSLTPPPDPAPPAGQPPIDLPTPSLDVQPPMPDPAPAPPPVPPVPPAMPDIAPPTLSPAVTPSDTLPAPAAMVGDFSAPPAASTPGQVVSGGFEPASAYPPQSGAPLPPLETPAAPSTPVFGGADPLAAVTPSSSKKRFLKPLIIALLAVVILGGGSAAAYFGVVVPNKPANVLKTAFLNSLQQTQSSTTGTVSGSGSGIAYKATFNTAENAQAKALDAQLNLTVSGITFPVETKLVNQSVYVKIGDLGTITSLINAFAPTDSSLIQSVSGDVSNKWIVFDSTLIDESAPLKCALNTNWTLTSADMKLLQTQYTKHPFTTIQSASSATVGGKAAEKFVLDISNSTLNSFGNGLQGLSAVKALQKCAPGSTNTSPASSSSLGKGKTPLTVWVDKGTKQIVQVAASSNTGGISAATTVTLHYGKVTITAPSNAEPALQVLGDIENSAKANPGLLNLLNGSSSAGSSTAGGTSGDSLLQ